MNGNSRLTLVLIAVLAVTDARQPSLSADEPPRQSIARFDSEVTDLAFFPNGKRLVCTSLRTDRILSVIWDDGRPSLAADAPGSITGARSHALAISPDGTQVAIAGFKVTAMYDLKTQKQQWQIDTSDIYRNPPTVKALAFSPDGKLLATSGGIRFEGRITIRNADTGKELHRFEGWWHHPAGHVSLADDGIAFSPDGKLFAAGSFGSAIGEGPRPGELRVWYAEKGELLHVWQTKESVQDGMDNAAIHGIAFSPDSRRIAIACSDGDVWIWDFATKEVSEKLKAHRKEVRRVTFSPDGQYLASGGRDQTVRVWSAKSWKQLASLPFDSPKINALSFSPDGTSLIAGGGDFTRSGQVRIWSVAELMED